MFERRDLRRDIMRIPEIVGVHGRYIFSSRLLYAAIASADKPTIVLIDHAEALVTGDAGADHRSGAIGGTVIDDDDLQIGIGLGGDGSECSLDAPGGIVSRNNN